MSRAVEGFSHLSAASLAVAFSQPGERHGSVPGPAVGLELGPAQLLSAAAVRRPSGKTQPHLRLPRLHNDAHRFQLTHGLSASTSALSAALLPHLLTFILHRLDLVVPTSIYPRLPALVLLLLSLDPVHLLAQ